LRKPFRFVELVLADSAYTFRRVKDTIRIVIKVVKKITDRVGFQVLPRRWMVERFFAWINRNRRLTKDFGGTVSSAEVFLYAASSILLARRLAQSKRVLRQSLSPLS